MSALYEQIRADVDQLLAELGRPIRFRRYTYVVDLVEGTSVPTLSSEQVLSAATVPPTGNMLTDLGVTFMSDVQADTQVRFALVSAEGALFAPGPKDKVELGQYAADGSAAFDGRVWDMIGCSPLDIDGTAVFFAIGFRLPS